LFSDVVVPPLVFVDMYSPPRAVADPPPRESLTKRLPNLS
jgi:hypothetical protein